MLIRRYNGGMWIKPQTPAECETLDDVHDALGRLFQSVTSVEFEVLPPESGQVGEEVVPD